MSTFPPEIYGIIAEHVISRRDLVNLISISTSVHAEVERVLYRAIHFTKYSPASFDALLDRLSTVSRLALFVQSLHLLFINRLPDSTQTKLAATLRATNNLRDLRTRIPGLERDTLTRGCKFQLYRFEGLNHTTAFLEAFLPCQPLIQHLSIPLYGTTHPLPLGILPHLVTLECPANLAVALDITHR